MSNFESMPAISVNLAGDPFEEVVETGDFDEAPSEDTVEDSDSNEDSETTPTMAPAADDDEDTSETEAGEQDSSEDSDEDEDVPSEKDVKKEEKEEKEEPEVDLAKQLEDGSLKIKTKVDGKEEEVTLAELKSNYAGKVAWDKKFTEVDKKEKAVKSEIESVNRYINDFAAKMRDGDSVGAMQYLASFAGTPPYMVKEQLIAALRPEILRREGLSELEIESESLKEQNEYLKQLHESESQKKMQEQAQTDLERFVNDLRKTHEIDEDTWQNTIDALDKQLPPEEVLTPQLVADTILYGRKYEHAGEILNSIDPSIANDKEWLDSLVNEMEKYPDATAEDFKEIVNETLAQLNIQTQKSKTKEAEQKLIDRVGGKKATNQQPKQKSVPQEMDIDPELEDWL